MGKCPIRMIKALNGGCKDATHSSITVGYYLYNYDIYNRSRVLKDGRR